MNKCIPLRVSSSRKCKLFEKFLMIAREKYSVRVHINEVKDYYPERLPNGMSSICARQNSFLFVTMGWVTLFSREVPHSLNFFVNIDS